MKSGMVVSRICFQYLITVRVSDGLVEEFTKVNIKVVKVNENRPKFVSTDTNIDIPENLKIGAKIGKLPLENPFENASLFYSIHNAQSLESLDMFSIDSQDGTINLRIITLLFRMIEHSPDIKCKQTNLHQDYFIIQL